MTCSPATPGALDLRDYDPMASQPLSAAQLREHLLRQLRFLSRSAAAVDAGEEDEAIRLAVAARVLLHQTATSHALLVQLGIRDTLRWVDTCWYRDDAEQRIRKRAGLSDDAVIAALSSADLGLVRLGHEPGTNAPRWVAPLDRTHATTVAFSDWWTRPGIVTSSERIFTREQLVKVLANKDGGAHVDPAVPDDYAEFTRDFLGVEYTPVPGDWTLQDPPGGWLAASGNVAMASMRQIAWELQETLRRAKLAWLTVP